MSPQGSPGNAKIDMSHHARYALVREVEMSSALAPLLRCRISSPLAVVLNAGRKRTAATLSARRRVENVASSSLGVPASKQRRTP